MPSEEAERLPKRNDGLPETQTMRDWGGSP